MILSRLPDLMILATLDRGTLKPLSLSFLVIVGLRAGLCFLHIVYGLHCRWPPFLGPPGGFPVEPIIKSAPSHTENLTPLPMPNVVYKGCFLRCNDYQGRKILSYSCIFRTVLQLTVYVFYYFDFHPRLIYWNNNQHNKSS